MDRDFKRVLITFGIVFLIAAIFIGLSGAYYSGNVIEAFAFEAKKFPGGVQEEAENFDSVDGYWLMRAPVLDAGVLTGESKARRYGPNLGNGRDVGVLWRQNTLDDEGKLLGDEERHCGAWTQFYFDEPNIFFGEINNIYCHSWLYMEETTLPVGEVVGISVDENYNSYAYYDNKDFYDSLVGKNLNYYDLSIYDSDLGYSFSSSEGLWGTSFKATGGYPQVLSYPNQKSFCIVNYNSQEIQDVDRDDDGLTDYVEMYETYTDPYDNDTDKDGRIDGVDEDGLEPYDWLRTKVYRLSGVGNEAFVKISEDVGSTPSPEAYDSELDREMTYGEYFKTWRYDKDGNEYSYVSAPWSSVQVNFRYDIAENPEDIRLINIYFGGVWISYDLEGEEDYKIIEVINQSGGDNLIIPAKVGHTPAFYLAQIRDNFEDYISDEGYLYVRAFTRNRLSSSSVNIDFSEVEVKYYRDCSDCLRIFR